MVGGALGGRGALGGGGGTCCCNATSGTTSLAWIGLVQSCVKWSSYRKKMIDIILLHFCIACYTCMLYAKFERVLSENLATL